MPTKTILTNHTNPRQSTWEDKLLGYIAPIMLFAAPLIPASIAYHNLTTVMGWQPLRALVPAAVIEALLLVAANTAGQRKRYNDSKRKIDPPASLFAPLGVGGFALAVVMFINVALEGVGVGLLSGAYAGMITNALLSLLSVAAAAMLALRAQDRERVRLIDANKTARRTARKEARIERQANAQKNASEQANERPQNTLNNRTNANEQANASEHTDPRHVALVRFYANNPGAPYSAAGVAVGMGKTWVHINVNKLIVAGQLQRRNGAGIRAIGGGA